MIHLKYIITILFTLIILFSCGPYKKDFKWPNGAKAAISLTYDDGLSSHVNSVAPILNKYKFKGTFYPTLSSSSLNDEIDKWKKLTLDGHEIGNHTIYHPCQKSESGMEWVKDEYDLDKYTSDKIADEIKLANIMLFEMDGNSKRTFAYPCSHYFAGGESYVGFVSSQFQSARGSSEEQKELKNISDIDIHKVPSWAPNNHGADDLISYIQKIIELETFSTITFHGIGAEHMTVSEEAHEKMLQFLDENRDKIWVGTFEENTEYLISKRTK